MADAAASSDDDLLTRAKDGDDEAFRALCERHAGRVRARVEPLLGAAVRRKVSVADVVQEALVVAHRKLDEFEARGVEAFGAWLAKIAELKAREAVRRYAGARGRDVGREVTAPGRPPTADAARTGPSASEVAAGKEEVERLRRALHDLSDDHRHVLELVELDGLTLAEAATLMGRSHEAVKKLYGRALARLGERLGRQGSADGR